MIQENEFITFVICVGVLIFFIVNYQKLKKLIGYKLFLTSFILYTCAWCFTVIEGFILEVVFNFIEHLCYISSSVAMVSWILIAFRKRK